AFAVNVADSAPDVAIREFEPAVDPSAHAPTVATPLAFVTCVPPVTFPPPNATANVTAAPETPFPFASVIRMLGAIDGAVPTVADCPSPASLTMFAAGPAVPVAVNVV